MNRNSIDMKYCLVGCQPYTDRVILVKVRSRTVGTAVFGASLAVISLRGYLVPGTPELTKQYLPECVLRWFEHEPSFAAADSTITIDPEQVHLTADTATLCRNGTDLCLTTEF